MQSYEILLLGNKKMFSSQVKNIFPSRTSETYFYRMRLAIAVGKHFVCLPIF